MNHALIKTKNNMEKGYQDWIAGAKDGINILNNFLLKNNRTESSMDLDHICYKCGHSAEYESIKNMLIMDGYAEWSHECMISGRRISFFKIKHPANYIPTVVGRIEYVELQDQNINGTQLSGFDHVEIIPKGKYNLPRFLQVLKISDFKFIRKKKVHHTTYDIKLTNGDNQIFIIKLSKGLLVNKIRREMVPSRK